jgi:hypothetical protein
MDGRRFESPVLDGNERTALLAAEVFLEINGITVERESEALYELTMGGPHRQADHGGRARARGSRGVR